ncbi:poly(R)-hydroxyalkanoic acid synthase subunit PhaE [Fulvimonas soli]|jgi:hypothetical protein|uniref:Poly(3-hydroxyalkanoate) polymerase subunit PhaE n=1 Tax=Fulvimonas soli TaxID=155197 RepID=A0A316I9L4_9GAMM|nr:poly(R)-hydroxyalkanoic acid synthase subunit PhaE [Fulvimonas soli]PWK89927.1 class III poly(R)-hydroxyalkanoic acid synthase PhaE subunit [Fulvimonas soli]TNY26359.1 hypothetical protein BV497_09120 [Fulvimonas soli]
MADPAGDFLSNYRALAQQAWDTWARSWAQSAAPAAQPAASAADPLARGGAALAGFLDWLRSAALQLPSASPGQWPPAWDAGQPFLQAFAGLDQHGAHGFAQQWQQWLQAMQQGGLADPRQPLAPLGYTREQQLQQQALYEAMQAYLQAAARYQSLLQRVAAQGAERLQAQLAQRAENGQSPQSLKALYDLWVDAYEEAYAEIALSDEFRAVYGAMVNAQMRVRQLQRQQTEHWCRELGMPTRSEVDSLGQRLQAMRRQVTALQRQLDAAREAAPAAAAPAGPRPSARKATRKAAAGKAAAVAKRPLRKPAAAAAARGTARGAKRRK